MAMHCRKDLNSILNGKSGYVDMNKLSRRPDNTSIGETGSSLPGSAPHSFAQRERENWHHLFTTTNTRALLKFNHNRLNESRPRATSCPQPEQGVIGNTCPGSANQMDKQSSQMLHSGKWSNAKSAMLPLLPPPPPSPCQQLRVECLSTVTVSVQVR